MKNLTILGATGSIGKNALKVISLYPEKFQIQALTAHKNVALLAQQVRDSSAKLAVVADKLLYNELKNHLSGVKVQIEAGPEAVIMAAGMAGNNKSDNMVISAIVGAAGLLPTMQALKSGNNVALANKECLVCAGQVMTTAANNNSATIIPVDSEHSAIFQVFDFKNPANVEKIILTASGGPFRDMSLADMQKATKQQAISHPNWDMGAKISVDSATMMNKGLEVIEAYHLFPVTTRQIEVVLHPESVVHSLVEYIDGSVLAQLGTPDMCTPIALALSWPNRIALAHTKLNLSKIGTLSFKPVPKDKFPALDLCYQALEQGGNMPAVLSTANEVAVAKFLEGKIGFLDIVTIVAKTLEKTSHTPLDSIEQVLETIRAAREIASEL